jgi:hypothetical protein
MHSWRLSDILGKKSKIGRAGLEVLNEIKGQMQGVGQQLGQSTKDLSSELGESDVQQLRSLMDAWPLMGASDRALVHRIACKALGATDVVQEAENQ